MSSKKSNLTTLSEFEDQHYGPRGAAKREKLEAGYENFKTSELSNLFGAYRSEETAEEIIAKIRSSRVSTRRTESLDDILFQK